jgi:glycosyltransferase involved in cell wall biosynthesis
MIDEILNNKEKEIMLSVIICTYNRDKYIYGVLKSIAENNFPYSGYEIVLINNNSTDNTEAECRRFQVDFTSANFHYFVEKEQGLSYARNRGIKEAKGEILIYVDDDATVNRVYLQTVADFFSANSFAAAGGGPIIPVYETKEPVWMSHFTRILITGYKYEGKKIGKFKNGKFPGGGNAAYRKQVFEKIGLFNTNLGRKGNSLIGAEEKDIFDRMYINRMDFYYLPTMILYHIIPATKLTNDYFECLTYSMGQSERMRTLSISRQKYCKRLLNEWIKWMVVIGLCIGFCLIFKGQKGIKLLLFRWYVSKGLLSK